MVVALLVGCSLPLAAQAMIQVSPTPKPTRTPAECVGVTAPPDATKDTPDFTSAGILFILPPDDPWHVLRGKNVEVRLLISARGTLDSAEVNGLSNDTFRKRYLRKIRDEVKGRHLQPAIYQGCAVDIWWTYKLAADGG